MPFFLQLLEAQIGVLLRLSVAHPKALPPRAVLILTPGETADLVNLEIKRRGLKRKED